jgi:hypothetical protein
MFFGKLVTLTAAALGVAHCAEPAAPSLVRFTSGSEPPKSPHYDGTAPVPAQIGTPFTLSMGANPTTGVRVGGGNEKKKRKKQKSKKKKKKKPETLTCSSFHPTPRQYSWAASKPTEQLFTSEA